MGKLKGVLGQLTDNEKHTFRLHLMYSIVEGMMAGAIVLNEFIFIKALLGSSYQLGALFQTSVIVLIFSVLFNELVRRAKSKKRLLKRVALLTHAPLALMLLFPKDMEILEATSRYHYIFLFIFLAYFLSRPFVYPTINLFLKNNYRDKYFGSLYSYGTSLQKITMLLTAFAFGVMLDFNPFVYRFVYPALGFLGVLSIFWLTRIKFVPAHEESTAKQNILYSVKDALKRMIGILKTNKPFLDYQLGFMLYGFAFMSTKAVITLFYDEALHLNYTSVAFYQNIFNVLAIFLLPVFGRLIGKIDPRKFAGLTFIALALYLFFIMITSYFPGHIEVWNLHIYYTLIIAVLFNGIFVATMSLAWYIGSAYFCSREEAGDYQSVHLTVTGIRGLVAPMIGVYFYNAIGFTGTFSIGIISLLLAVMLLLYSKRKHTLTLQQ